MRIAYFCPHSDPLAATGEPDSGGQCLYEARVAAQLAEMGHEVRAFTRQWGDKPAVSEIGPGATVHRHAMGPSGFLRKEDMGPHLAQFTARVLEEHGDWLAACDVIQGHYWDGGASALMAALGLGRPLIFTSHSLGRLKRDRLPDDTPGGARFNYELRIRAEQRVLDAADKVIALSGNEKDALVERYGTPAGKIAIVPGGVDIGAFAPCDDKQALQRQLGFTTDFMLFTAGRLDPRKGFLELLDALPVVLERLKRAGRTATFCLPAGPKNPSPEERSYRDALHGRAEQLGIADVIHWFNRLDDDQLKTWYRAADLFLCPSHYEPFGLVLVEAFASGTPVVATSRGGPAGIVTPAIDGYLADPMNPREFGGHIADALLASASVRKAMQRAALEKARSRYSWRAVARGIEAVYGRLPHGLRK